MRMLQNILELLFWSLMVGFLLVAIATVTGWALAPFLSYFSFIMVIVVVPLLVRMAVTIRRRTASSILSYLDQAIALNLPLPRFLFAAQRSEHGKTAYRLAVLRQRIEEGIPIAAALQFTAPEV